MISTKALDALGYETAIKEISKLTVSFEGRVLLEKSRPITDNKVKKIRRERREGLVAALRSPCAPRLHSWPPVKDLIEQLKTDGATLDIEKLFSVLLFLKSAREAIKSALIFNNGENKDAGETVIKVCNEVEKAFLANGQLRDTNEMCAIKKRIKTLEGRKSGALDKYIKDARYIPFLENTSPVLRDGFDALAIKTSARGKFQGLILGSSASGSTTYLIPLEVLECLNALTDEKSALDEEIRRVIKVLSKDISCDITPVLAALDEMALLDADLAVARWAIDKRCAYAQEGEGVEIFCARHPLIKDPVPIDIIIPKDIKVLILTGANAGGKTAALKTLGLFTILNEAAIPLPAESATLPAFDSVFVDIGDEQSLVDGESTFSAHVKNLSVIAQKAGPRTLSLLDELGRGTDENEGGSLAMAILDRLKECGGVTAVTTHLGAVKNYGTTSNKAICSAVEFTKDLTPTYKILFHVTGESHALDVALKCSMPRDIIKKAREYLSSGGADLSKILKNLESKSLLLDQERRALDLEKNKIKTREEKVSKREEKVTAERERLKKDEARTESQWLASARKELENLVRTLREGEITREKTLAVKSFIAKKEHAIEKYSTPQPPTPINKEGEGSSERYDNVPTALEKLQEHFKGGDTKEAKWRGDYSVEYADNKNRHAKFELRLLGLRRDEAIKALEEQLDCAIKEDTQYFSIIHGKGEGILSEAVRETLARYKSVAPGLHFETAPYEDGGAGKTYVYLR